MNNGTCIPFGDKPQPAWLKNRVSGEKQTKFIDMEIGRLLKDGVRLIQNQQILLRKTNTMCAKKGWQVKAGT